MAYDPGGLGAPSEGAGVSRARPSPRFECMYICTAGTRAHSHQTYQLTRPGFWGLENWGEWGEIGRTGGGGVWEIAGIAHGMWVVEGCRKMWLRKMG